jgi:hypothetical protein
MVKRLFGKEETQRVRFPHLAHRRRTMIKFVVIFFALFLTDIVWALYIRWSANGLALKAAIASIFIYVIGAFTFAEFIKDFWVIIPASLGCFVGTYITVKLDSEKNKSPLRLKVDRLFRK